MRQKISSGSVTGYCLSREAVLKKLEDVSRQALCRFPEIIEVRLIGSLARGDQTGLSDIDIFIFTERKDVSNPVERVRPYFNFFAEKMEIGTDVMVAVRGEEVQEEILSGSIVMARRN